MVFLTGWLSGLLTPLLAAVGCWLGLRWWQRLRRSEGAYEPDQEIVAAPPPPAADDAPVINRVSHRSRPARVYRPRRR